MLRCYEGLASLKLSVVLLTVAAVVLVAATFVEKHFGTEAALFGIYRGRWFVVLNVLLFLNVLCAILIRFPWKRQQTGFLVMHVGILTLLLGSWLTQHGGVEAFLSVCEEGTSHTAYNRDDARFELEVFRDPAVAPQTPSAPGRAAAPPGADEPAVDERIAVPFRPGPFNWDDLDRWYLLLWRWAHRDQGLLYDRDGIRLEVLDYLRDSDLTAAPPLVLGVKSRASQQPEPSGSARGTRETVRLWAPVLPDLRSGEEAARSWWESAAGLQVVFWVARSQAETEAFLQSAPGKDEPLGKSGRVVVTAGGQRYSLPLDGWAKGEERPLGNSGLGLVLTEANVPWRRIDFSVRVAGRDRGRLRLLADLPQRNVHDDEHGVFATYWRPSEPKAVGGPREGIDKMHAGLLPAGGPRIDIIQGADRSLYCRAWNPPKVEMIGELPVGERPLEVFPGSEYGVALDVKQYVPHDWPGGTIEPHKFTPGQPPASGQREEVPARALVQLTVDGHRERFWIEPLQERVGDPRPPRTERNVVFGDGRRVAISLRQAAVELGFDVLLREFERRLDPGSPMVSEYSSYVDISDREAPDKRLAEDVLITLNEPASVADPKSGRCYRLYQSGFHGPWGRNHPEFLRRLGPKSKRNELFMSVLAVNYDPGRPLKYAGTLIILAGLVIVYYVRGYGHKPPMTNDERKMT